MTRGVSDFARGQLFALFLKAQLLKQLVDIVVHWRFWGSFLVLAKEAALLFVFLKKCFKATGL